MSATDKLLSPKILMSILEEVKSLNENYQTYNETLPCMHSLRTKTPVPIEPLTGSQFTCLLQEWCQRIESIAQEDAFKILLCKKSAFPAALKHPKRPRTPHEREYNSKKEYEKAALHFVSSLETLSNKLLKSNEKFVSSFANYKNIVKKRREILANLQKSSLWQEARFCSALFSETIPFVELPNPTSIISQNQWLAELELIKKVLSKIIRRTHEQEFWSKKLRECLISLPIDEMIKETYVKKLLQFGDFNEALNFYFECSGKKPFSFDETAYEEKNLNIEDIEDEEIIEIIDINDDDAKLEQELSLHVDEEKFLLDIEKFKVVNAPGYILHTRKEKRSKTPDIETR